MLQKTFLNILKSALMGEKTTSLPTSTEEYDSLLRLSEIHRVLPLIFHCLHTSADISSENSEFFHKRVKLLVSQQTIKTCTFSDVYSRLAEKGLTPIVAKGIICRNLYPQPDFRISSDEDLLIPEDEYSLYREALLSLGFYAANSNTADRYQNSFLRNDGLHIELHTALFDTEESFFDKWNALFSECFENSCTICAENTRFRTLAPTEHLLYLILHAMKHFIHSGVGIRQICDITVFANSYCSEIDFKKLLSLCKSVNAKKFAMGIFAIGKNHLNLDEQVSEALQKHAQFPTDETSLLEDILSAGIFGSSTMSRRHSSSITFSGAKGKDTSVLRKLFPKAKKLDSRYSYAKKYPVLLPLAWAHRLISYKKELKNTDNNSPFESVRIGNKRLDLLKEYGILPTK